MNGWWGDVNARARGLAGALPTGADLQALAREPSVPALGRALAAHGVGRERPPATAAELDAAVRRWAGGRLSLLGRRMGPRRARAARILLDDADRRAVRALLRGAAEGAPAPARLSGLAPTHRLPLARLESLAGCDSIEALAEGLERLGHPAAAPLRAGPAGTIPDLFALEGALDRTYARRALEGAGRHGDLAAFVREEIDLRNAWSLLVLSGVAEVDDVDRVYVAGGTRIPAARFRELCGTEAERVRASLATLFGPGPLSDLFRDADATAAIERRALGLRMTAWARRARAAPLGPAPFLVFGLRLAAVTHDLCALAWGCALDVPAGRRLPELRRPA